MPLAGTGTHTHTHPHASCRDIQPLGTWDKRYTPHTPACLLQGQGHTHTFFRNTQPSYALRDPRPIFQLSSLGSGDPITQLTQHKLSLAAVPSANTGLSNWPQIPSNICLPLMLPTEVQSKDCEAGLGEVFKSLSWSMALQYLGKCTSQRIKWNWMRRGT